LTQGEDRMESQAYIGRERILILGLLLTQPSAMNPIVEFLTAATFITGIIVYVARLAINKGFDVALKNHQNRLDIMKKEHEIKFTSLHNERAVVIKDLYQKLLGIEKSLKILAYPGRKDKPSYIILRQTPPNSGEIKRVIAFVQENGLFFDNQVYESILDTLNKSVNYLHNIKELKKKMNGIDKTLDELEDTDESVYNFLISEWAQLSADIVKLVSLYKEDRKEIADQFRELLGVKK